MLENISGVYYKKDLGAMILIGNDILTKPYPFKIIIADFFKTSEKIPF